MEKKAPDLVVFTKELKKLMDKHGLFLCGRVSTQEKSENEVYSLDIKDRWTSGSYVEIGPFLIGYIDSAPSITDYSIKKKSFSVMDKDKLLANGVVSPLDGKTAFHNRRDWADHLKRNGCVEFGNDLNNAKPREEVRGDFNVRDELGKATHQVMEKYGH